MDVNLIVLIVLIVFRDILYRAQTFSCTIVGFLWLVLALKRTVWLKMDHKTSSLFVN